MEGKYFFLISFLLLRNSILYYYFPNLPVLIAINTIELILLLLYTNENLLENIKNFCLGEKTVSDQAILTIIQNKDLQKFESYLKENKISASQLTKMVFKGNFTPFDYAILNESFEIFQYMIKFGVDINYRPNKGMAPLIRACYYAPKKFVKEFMKYKSSLNLNEKCDQFKANCLEIAVWRGRHQIVQILLENGMQFSVEEYNQTECSKLLGKDFSTVSLDVKKELIKHKLFENKLQQFNIHDKIINKEIRVESLNSKPYILENYILYS